MNTDFPQTPRRTARRRTLLAGALLVALGGCAALVPESSDSSDRSEFSAVAVPSAWSAAPASVTSTATPLAQWWLRFDDAQLSSLVSDALQANTSVRSAQAALRQARALRDVSAAALWPTLGSSASAQRGKADGQSASNSLSAGLDASWEVDVFGGNRSALDASEASARASAASLADTQVSIAAEVALDYITLRDAQARLAIASDNLASQQETLQITQWRLQAGLATALDVEQARTSAEQTSALLPPLQTTIAQTAHALAVLSGQPPAALTARLASSGPLPLPQAPGDLALSLPADTLRQRPDVRAAEHRVGAALANVAQAEAARLPNFTIGGSLGLTALTLGALGDGASVLSSLVGGVTLPVFDDGAARAQVRAQQAALDQATMAYQAAILTALKDVENALVALDGDRQRLSRLQRAAQAAANAAALARQRYASGLVDFQVVLETQRTQLVTQESVAISSANVSTDHVQLYKALGGGWQPTPSDLSINTASRTPNP